jgi:hypothetical protein
MSDKDDLEREIANVFGEKLVELMVETQSQLAHAGLPSAEIFMVQLVSAAARVSLANHVNRDTFDETIRAIADREYQPKLDHGLTTRQRGSA